MNAVFFLEVCAFLRLSLSLSSTSGQMKDSAKSAVSAELSSRESKSSISLLFLSTSLWLPPLRQSVDHLVKLNQRQGTRAPSAVHNISAPSLINYAYY